MGGDEDSLLVTTPARADAVREEMGPAGGRVATLDSAAVYASPRRMWAGLLARLADRVPGRPLRIAAEPAIGGYGAVLSRAFAQYEAASNHVYAGAARVLCAFDVAALPDAVVADVRRTHPLIDDPVGPRVNPGFRAPRDFLAAAPRPVAGAGERQAFAVVGDLRRLRAFVRERALAAGLAAEPAEDLVMAVTEVATNALRHGRPPFGAEVARDAAAVACSVSDAGGGPDVLVGMARAGGDLTGLDVVRRLCDLVQVRPGLRETTVDLVQAL